MGMFVGKIKRQLNVGEQIELVRLRIVAHTDDLRKGRMRWLDEILLDKGEVSSDGVVAEFRAVTEQDGEYVCGLWLNSSLQFFEFEALLSFDRATVIEIEKWKNVTGSVVVSAHLPGTGHSIGNVAMTVLKQRVEA